jgi:hypothetical protein
MIKSLITAVAFVLISASLGNAGPVCAKQVGNVCLQKERIAVTCCCRVANGGTCCAETMFCGGIIPGCFCTGYNEEPQVTRVSTKPLNK